MKTTTMITIVLMACLTACAQSAQTNPETTPERSVGSGCEGCEAVLEYGKKQLTWTDTLPDFHEPGQKLEISGTIYERDGKSPAQDVILYIYHTDQTGKYTRRGNDIGSRHGYIRGWIRTNSDGKYKFYTLKPGAYPEGGNPAHIHPIIKEPGIQEYWIDEYLFDGDPYLTAKIRRNQQGRGGPGILVTKIDKNGMLITRRDIILGLNVPGYE
ncbi:MAG TPA: intradiol ring-cleavage dioxygenase [Cyclobacteriaceae bacterium]|jgi:protocatechuate 3,4-dioxygenase beta subunit